jgi:CBS domain-containing protein
MLAGTVQSVLADKKNQRLHAVTPATSVSQAVKIMNRHNIGSLLVMQGRRLVGIFTERDVLKRVVGAKMNPESTAVCQVMTADVLCIKPSTRVEEAMNIMIQKRYRHLPVAEDDTLLGMISNGDLSRWVIRDQQELVDDLISGVIQFSRLS